MLEKQDQKKIHLIQRNILNKSIGGDDVVLLVCNIIIEDGTTQELCSYQAGFFSLLLRLLDHLLCKIYPSGLYTPARYLTYQLPGTAPHIKERAGFAPAINNLQDIVVSLLNDVYFAPILRGGLDMPRIGVLFKII